MDRLLKFVIAVFIFTSCVGANIKPDEVTVPDVGDREYTIVLPAPTKERTVVFMEEEHEPIVSYPEYIAVRVTGLKDCRGLDSVSYRTVYIEFKEYVKGVLPNKR